MRIQRATSGAHGRATSGAHGLALAIGLIALAALAPPARAATRSSSLALAGNNTRLFNVNFEADSVTVFAVQDGGKSLVKLDEVGVGREPVCVATRGLKAWVTNSASGTVSVISRQGGAFRTIGEIDVGDEPRGCAVSDDGKVLLVANHTDGTISVIDTASDQVVSTIPVGGNPAAIAIDGNRVFVTDFFARLIDGGPGEGFDEGKEGVVRTFTLGNPGSVSEITLSPIADSAHRRPQQFCNATADPDPVNQA
jgi:YVTN family beta-propeller protein